MSATAKKLALIIWNIIEKGVQYINPEGDLILDKKKKTGHCEKNSNANG